jgi:hypothetical protein
MYGLEERERERERKGGVELSQHVSIWLSHSIYIWQIRE